VAKLSLLSAILLADLFFFLFSTLYYHRIFQIVLEILPWEDTAEEALIIIAGLIIAVLSSTKIISILVKALQKSA
jgi:hypothetical protein